MYESYILNVRGTSIWVEVSLPCLVALVSVAQISEPTSMVPVSAVIVVAYVIDGDVVAN